MNNKQIISFKNFLPGIAWFFIVCLLTLLPGKDVPEVDMFHIPQFDKLVHAGMFCVLTFLFCLPYLRANWPDRHKKKMWYRIATVMITWGLMIEIIQKNFIPGRSFEWLDWLADSIGVGIALWICYKIVRSEKIMGKISYDQKSSSSILK